MSLQTSVAAPACRNTSELQSQAMAAETGGLRFGNTGNRVAESSCICGSLLLSKTPCEFNPKSTPRPRIRYSDLCGLPRVARVR